MGVIPILIAWPALAAILMPLFHSRKMRGRAVYLAGADRRALWPLVRRRTAHHPAVS